jgi:hypothetical protein
MARTYPLYRNADLREKVGDVVIQNELELPDALDGMHITPVLQTENPEIPHVVAFSISAIPATPA